MVLDVQLADLHVGRCERVAVRVEDAAESLRSEVGSAQPRHRQPRRDGRAHRGVCEPAVETGQVFERAHRRVGRDAARTVREDAAGGGEVFEEQHEASVLARVGPVGARHSQIDGRRHVRVELDLPLAHPARADHLPVRGVEGQELHEQRRRAGSHRAVRETDAQPLVGRDGAIENLDIRHVGAEGLGQPRGREIGGIDRHLGHGRSQTQLLSVVDGFHATFTEVTTQ